MSSIFDIDPQAFQESPLNIDADPANKDLLAIDVAQAKEEQAQIDQQIQQLSSQPGMPGLDIYDYQTALESGADISPEKLPLAFFKEPLRIGGTDLRTGERPVETLDEDPNFARKTLRLLAQIPAGAADAMINTAYNTANLVAGGMSKTAEELKDLSEGMKLVGELTSSDDPERIKEILLSGKITPFTTAATGLFDSDGLDKAARSMEASAERLAVSAAVDAAEFERTVAKIFPEAESLPESLLRGVTEYLAAYFPLFKAVRVAGAAAAPAFFVSSAAASGFAFGPEDPTLSTLLASIDHPATRNAVTEFLSVKEEDSPREKVAKRAMEDALITLLGAGLGKVVAGTIVLAKDAKKFTLASKAAEARARLASMNYRRGISPEGVPAEELNQIIDDLGTVMAFEIRHQRVPLQEAKETLMRMGLRNEEISYVMRKALLDNGVNDVTVASIIKGIDAENMQKIAMTRREMLDISYLRGPADELTRVFYAPDTGQYYGDVDIFLAMLARAGMKNNPTQAIRRAAEVWNKTIATSEKAKEAAVVDGIDDPLWDDLFDRVMSGSDMLDIIEEDPVAWELAMSLPSEKYIPRRLPVEPGDPAEVYARRMGLSQDREYVQQLFRKAIDAGVSPAAIKSALVPTRQVPGMTFRSSLENIPGSTTSHLKDMSPKKIEEYERVTDEILYTKGGRSKILEELKWWSAPREQSTGVYEGEYNAVNQVDILGDNTIGKTRSEALAYLHSLLTYQNAAAGHALLSQGDRGGLLSAAAFELGTKPTPEMLQKLEREIMARYGDFWPAIVADSKGVRILFTNPEMGGKFLNEDQFKALGEAVGLPEDSFRGAFQMDGFYRETDWSKDVAGNEFFYGILDLPLSYEDKATLIARYQKFGPQIEQAHRKFGKTHFQNHGIMWLKVRHASTLDPDTYYKTTGRKLLLLDPAYYRKGGGLSSGTVTAGEEYGAYVVSLPKDMQKRTFFYIDDPDAGIRLKPEDVELRLKGKVKWESDGKIPLYDLYKDPLGLKEKAKQILKERNDELNRRLGLKPGQVTFNPTENQITREVEIMLHERGFSGWFNRKTKAGVSFRHVAVKKGSKVY